MKFIPRQVKKAAVTFKRSLSGKFSFEESTETILEEDIKKEILKYMVRLPSKDLYELVRQALLLRTDQQTNCSVDCHIEETLLKSFLLPVDCIEELGMNQIPPTDPRRQNELDMNQKISALRVKIPSEQTFSMRNLCNEKALPGPCEVPYKDDSSPHSTCSSRFGGSPCFGGIPEHSIGVNIQSSVREGEGKVVGSRWSTSSRRITLLTAANLLGGIFPSEALGKLKCEMGDSIAKHHPSVSVFFSDLVGFTDWCATKSPDDVIECLSAYFQILDDLAEVFGVYKVETVGDAWMGVCGAPESEVHHADILGHFAIQVLKTLGDLEEIFQSSSISLRIGLHCGPVVGGVVRTDRPRWQLFGDTVNMASRMESTSIPGHIQISREMYNALISSPRTTFTYMARGPTEIKGKGSQETFFLTGLETDMMYDSDAAMYHADNGRLTIFNPPQTPKSIFRLRIRTSSILQNRLIEQRQRHTISTTEDFNLFLKSNSEYLETRKRRCSLFCDTDPSFPNAQDAIKAAEYLQQKSILVVDEMPSILMQFRRVLKRTGLTIYTARDGQQALELLKERDYVIVFMDLSLPGIDGSQCVQQFREWESWYRTNAQPVIALSDNCSTDEQGLCALGFSGFIHKNGKKKDILQQVFKWLFRL